MNHVGTIIFIDSDKNDLKTYIQGENSTNLEQPMKEEEEEKLGQAGIQRKERGKKEEIHRQNGRNKIAPDLR